MSWTSILGTVGSVLSVAGAAKSLLGGGTKSYGGQSIQQKVADAKAAGIHPLYALGATTQSPTFIAGQNAGERLSNLGNELQSVGEQYKKTPGVTPLEKKQMEEIESRTILNLAEAGEAKARSESIMPGQNTATAPVPPLPAKYIQVRDPLTGQVEWVPNPDIYEMPEIIGGYEYARTRSQQGKTGRPQVPHGYKRTSRGRRRVKTWK